jgi:trehalose synthase
MIRLDDYTEIVGKQTIERIKVLASRLEGKKIKMINSTSVGGGVAEILHRLVPLLNELGIHARWDVIKGGEDFFIVTKMFHNALHGKEVRVSEKIFDTYLRYNKMNASQLSFDEDFIVVHDPQPLAIVQRKEEVGGRWIWRCHVDVSNPEHKVWRFLLRFIKKYDASIFSCASFAKELPHPQFLIYPSIDPLSEKNRELSKETIEGVLQKYGIPQDKPIISQISRFDLLKDPLGVVKAYKLVKKDFDCRLLLVGNAAADDPEALGVYHRIKEVTEKDPDVHVIFLEPNDPLEVNAFQRASTIIVQKSIREGFGLTVTEALWKGKPVIGGAVGGILVQIQHNINGMLVHSVEGTAYYIKHLLTNPELARRFGENGREFVRQNFLITRHVRDYLLLMIAMEHPQESIITLNQF